MPFTVQAFADDPAHGLGDDVRHLQANRLNRALALGIDVPTGRLHDAPRFFAGLLLSLLLNLFGGPVRSLNDLPGLLPGPLNLTLGFLPQLLGLFPSLFRLLQLLFDHVLALLGSGHDPWVDPARE